MRLQSIELREFRNHREARLDLRGDSALVLGDNGSGKTNLIEAVVLLSIGKSFRGARDPDMTRRGSETFEVRGLVADRLGVTTEIVARGSAGGPKEVLVDGAPLARLTDLLGRFRTVHFSVEDVAALNGAPSSRRRFLDVALCQLEPAYVGCLREYGAALRQRNRLLILERHGPGAEEAEWAAWEEILAREGAALDRRRHALCRELERHLRDLARAVDPDFLPALTYRDGFGPDRDEGEEALLRAARLKEGRAADRKVGWTMHGPHRARLGCSIGGEDLAEGASRGYSRLYSILMRLALARVFEERHDEAPVVLLDDPESELDPRWIGRLLALIPPSSQTVVAACRELSKSPDRFRRIPIGSTELLGSAA